MILNIEKGLERYNKLYESRQERFFKSCGEPCNLLESLLRQSKTDLDRIRQTYGFTGMSALNKAELADELNNRIPDVLDQIFKTMDRTRYDLLMGIVDNNGVIAYSEIGTKERETLRKSGVLFHGVSEDRKILYIPEDILLKIRTLNVQEIEKIIERNTEWILLAHGLVYYMGVMNLPQLEGKVRSYSSHLMNNSDFRDCIRSASDYYGIIKISGFYWYHRNLTDPERFADEQEQLAEFGDYPFTRDQLLCAGMPDYIEKTPNMKKLMSTLKADYGISSEELNKIAEEIILSINTTSSSKMILTYLTGLFEFPSLAYIRRIEMIIVELLSTTRLWVLKGYTLLEIEAKKDGIR